MSISYQPKQAPVLGKVLKTQEVVVQLGDAFITTSASDVTIEIGEPIQSVLCAVFCDDSAPSAAKVIAKASITTPTTTSIKLALGAALAADDAVIVRYAVKEQ